MRALYVYIPFPCLLNLFLVLRASAHRCTNNGVKGKVHLMCGCHGKIEASLTQRCIKNEL